MNILAGNLFQNINPNIEPFKTQRFRDDSNANVIKTINIHEESKPSIPSTKLEKLIIALIKITKVIINNDSIKKEYSKLLRIFELLIMKIDVIVWDKNLNQDGRLNLSSIKPTTANGKQKIKIYCFAINPYTTEIRTNINPPLVGVGKK
tara:strand:+ start:940 stop:1386 length:447 start_codon:yes stop_codon:yes gene_type:complete